MPSHIEVGDNWARASGTLHLKVLGAKDASNPE